MKALFRIVQPRGPDKANQSTLISEHATAADAFTEIDRLAREMVRTGAPSDVVELVAIDQTGEIVPTCPSRQAGEFRRRKDNAERSRCQDRGCFTAGSWCWSGRFNVAQSRLQ